MTTKIWCKDMKNKRETILTKVNNKFVRNWENKWASQGKTNICQQDKSNGRKNSRTIIVYLRVTKRTRRTAKLN